MGREDYARSEVRIPHDLNKKIKRYIIDHGFRSVSQFIVYLIEKELKEKD